MNNFEGKIDLEKGKMSNLEANIRQLSMAQGRFGWLVGERIGYVFSAAHVLDVDTYHLEYSHHAWLHGRNTTRSSCLHRQN